MAERIPSDAHGRPILTVAELRTMLEGLNGDTHVVIASDGWYTNVAEVGIPEENDDTYSCLTFTGAPGANFDSRQM